MLSQSTLIAFLIHFCSFSPFIDLIPFPFMLCLTFHSCSAMIAMQRIATVLRQSKAILSVAIIVVIVRIDVTQQVIVRRARRASSIPAV